MSVDYSKPRQTTLGPASLAVKSGDVVVVWEHPELVNSDSDGWYLAEILFCEDRARQAGSSSMLQVADVDTGALRWCHVNCIQKVLISVSHPVTGF